MLKYIACTSFQLTIMKISKTRLNYLIDIKVRHCSLPPCFRLTTSLAFEEASLISIRYDKVSSYHHLSLSIISISAIIYSSQEVQLLFSLTPLLTSIYPCLPLPTPPKKSSRCRHSPSLTKLTSVPTQNMFPSTNTLHNSLTLLSH